MPYTEISNKKHRIYYLSNSKARKKMNALTLSKTIDGFLLACHARRLSEHTIADYKNTFRKFVAHVGDIDISAVQSAQVTAFMAMQKVSAKTLLNYHVGLSALWTWAVREGYTNQHVMRLVDKPKPRKVVIEPFSEAEVRALLTGFRTTADRDRLIVLMLLDTGMRASELCNIRLSDIDMQSRRIKVLGKGDKERILPISTRTSAVLQRYIQGLPDDQDELFTFDRNHLGRQLRRIGRRVKVRAHPHKFRHTFAINFLRNGGDAYTLQALLGHSTLDTVKIYLHIAQVDLDAQHKRASPVEHWKL